MSVLVVTAAGVDGCTDGWMSARLIPRFHSLTPLPLAVPLVTSRGRSKQHKWAGLGPL